MQLKELWRLNVSEFRAGFIGVIGRPNAGKSTLVNWLTGEKVAIVTHKPQTTRKRVAGIINHEHSQIVLVDSPGIVKATKGLNRFLADEYRDVISGADALLVLLNVDEEKFDGLGEIIDLAKESGKPWLGVVNKIDLNNLSRRVSILRFQIESAGMKVIETSAKEAKEDSRLEILNALTALLPESPGPLYDPEIYTTTHIRDLTAELILEECFEKLHQEVPYGVAVRIVQFIEDQGDIVKIHAEVLVAKENHKPMVIGEKAQTIKAIGIGARAKIEKLVERKVFLDLRVSVRRDWFENSSMLKELGYVIPQD